MGIDLLAVTEHHKDDGKFRGKTSLNNKAMEVAGFHNVATHRAPGQKGGTAWYWKKGLNVEHWE